MGHGTPAPRKAGRSGGCKARLDVDALQKHINGYFTLLLDILNAHGGDSLRFMGDALLVTWAFAADAYEPDALRELLASAIAACCRCAL